MFFWVKCFGMAGKGDRRRRGGANVEAPWLLLDGMNAQKVQFHGH